MIKSLIIKQYRKLKNIEINFNDKVNVISGTNGTCKSSILYLISNAFQGVKVTSERFNDLSVITNIKAVNPYMNLKIESLTRGDDKYNDPAKGEMGALFTCKYSNDLSLDFRRHNSSLNKQNRFALKPYYKKGSNEKLPQCPVIYLGLSRLYAFGEYQKDITSVNKRLPTKYLEEIAELYKDFTGIQIKNSELQSMEGIKRRTKFSTDFEGIDSNTISSGEDNLLIIITSLVSLRYYYESLVSSTNEEESILLIDEVDATLHPEFQFKLLDVINEFAEDYKIKCVFTTHSLSLIDYAFQKKNNVIYFLDNISDVINMEDPDIYKIKMYLHNKTSDDFYLNNSIPVFTEDKEARLFLDCLFDYYLNNHKSSNRNIHSLFYFVDVNISANVLVKIFQDNKLIRSTMRAVCIIDGDKLNFQEISNYTIALPGKTSPEKLCFNYAEKLLEEDSDFWKDKTIITLGYTKKFYLNTIKKEIDSKYIKMKDRKNRGESNHGTEREILKKIFNKYRRFFEFIMKKWIESNNNEVNLFFYNLHTLFLKVAEFHNVSVNEWLIDSKKV